MVRLNPRSFKVVESDGMPTAANEPTSAEPVLGEPPRDATVGDVLREAREATGQDLRDVARLLRIRYDNLQAIEDGRLEVLPGATYAVGFVRAYAQHLGLDADRLLTQFRAELGGLGKAKELVFPAAPPEGKFLSGTVIAFALVLVVGAFGGWYYVNNQDRLSFDRVFAPEVASDPVAPPEEAVAGTAAAPEVAAVYEPPAEETPVTEAPVEEAQVAELPPEPAAVVPTPEPAPAPAPELAAAASAPEPESTPDRTPAIVVDAPAPVATDPEPELAAAAPTPEPSAEPAAEEAPLQPIAAAEAAPPAAPQTAALPAVPESATTTGQGRVYGRPNRDARVIVTAVDDSWIQIEDGAQNVVFTRMLSAGDSYRVPNRGGLKLKTGNAGGLTISVDGADVPPIGARGEILQNVALNPTLLKSGQASSP